VIQLQILSGKQAGSDIVVRRFPFIVGRGADADLRLDDAGVWDRHAEIGFRRKEGFSVAAQGEASVGVNGERTETAMLRNGDVMELGSVQLRFWLARSQQKTLRVREALAWTALFALFAAQIGLIYWLLR
jgi:predicted component of type VI protein secretion system